MNDICSVSQGGLSWIIPLIPFILSIALGYFTTTTRTLDHRLCLSRLCRLLIDKGSLEPQRGFLDRFSITCTARSPERALETLPYRRRSRVPIATRNPF